MQNKFLAFLGLIKRTGNIIEGYNKCEEAIKYKKDIYLFVFSNEVSLKSKDKFVYYCERNNIPYIQGLSKEDLGGSIGRTEINIIAITDKNMSLKLLSNYNDLMSQKTIGGD